MSETRFIDTPQQNNASPQSVNDIARIIDKQECIECIQQCPDNADVSQDQNSNGGQLKITFNVINVINSLIHDIKKHTNLQSPRDEEQDYGFQQAETHVISLDQIKDIVDQRFNYIKTSQHVSQADSINLLHLQFMPISAEMQIEGESYYRSRQLVRQHMQLSPNKNHVVTINLNNMSTVHQFGAKPFPFAYMELQAACVESFGEIQLNASIGKQLNAVIGNTVKMSYMPVGLQFQACWCEGRWILASKTFGCINDQKADGCSMNMTELLDYHLKQSGLSVQHMDKSRIYTFLLSRSEFNKWIPMQNQLYLLSIFDTVSKGAIEEDAVKKSSLPRIYSTSFKVADNMNFKQFRSLFQNNCNNAISADKPIASIIIKNPSGVLYELETDCGALIKQISLWEKQSLNVKQCIKNERTNKYAQLISNPIQQQPKREDVFITRDMFRQMPSKRCLTANPKE